MSFINLSVWFDKLKHIPSSYKCIVGGYIHKCQDLLPSNVVYYQIPDLINCMILLFYYPQIESSILTESESDTLISLFETNKKFTNLSNYHYKMIYSSKQWGLCENIFKKRVHDKENILCLIQISNGCVFGGFTATGWTQSVSGCQYDKEAFIFSIRSSRNYTPKIFNCVDHSDALWNGLDYYCVFGGNCAFYITDRGETGRGRADVVIAGTYEEYPNEYYLTGERQFHVVSIEVFQLSS
eukprot:351361_1